MPDDDAELVPYPRRGSAYSIEWLPPALRALRKLDQQIARRLTLKVSALAQDPRPAGVKALTGAPDALRIRVGDYRVVYEIHDDRLVVLVLTLGHRREVYRKL